MSLAERAAALLVPKPFQEFLPYVSPSALRVVHKDKVLGLALEIAARTVKSPSTEDWKPIELAFRASGSKIRIDSQSGTGFKSISEGDRTRAGELLLELYFHLIHQPTPLELDLRPTHFSFHSVEKTLVWNPSRLRHIRTPEFQSRVIDLYRGFFFDDAKAAARGLELYRWETTPKPGYDERMEKLLRIHFGDARSKPVLFEISHFKETFHLIFEEAIESRTRFHPELTFLGTTLTGLYMSLEQLAVPLDVRAAYLRATGGQS
ncbi:MAG: hypothetical protein H7301_01890 [Cryobacterium sp.]|nr:hypothetical protein [Oligoflexia bacterium]